MQIHVILGQVYNTTLTFIQYVNPSLSTKGSWVTDAHVFCTVLHMGLQKKDVCCYCETFEEME